MNTKIIRFGLVILMAMVLAGSAFAQEENKEAKITNGTIEGEISAIGKDYISIVYKTDPQKGIEYEMMIPFEDGVKYERVKGLKQLQVGDTISIQYQDTTEELEDGPKIERKAKVVSFVKAKVAKPEPPKPPEPGDE